MMKSGSRWLMASGSRWLMAIVLFGAGTLFRPVSVAGAQEGALDEERGKTLFVDMKCNVCHSVESQGIERLSKSDKMAGPDFSDLAAENLDQGWVVLFLKQETEKNGKKHRRAFKGSDEELDAVIVWLLSLKTEP